MTRRPWRGALVGRAVRLAQRATPRLEAAYTQLPDWTGVRPGLDAAAHEQRLLRYYAELRDRLAGLRTAPSFSLLIAAGSGPDLDRTLATVQLQLYERWQVCVVARDGSYGSALQQALEEATGDYVVVVDPGDRLYPSALAEFVRAFDLETRLGGAVPEVAYSDERTVDDAGELVGEPLFKPGWSPLLLQDGDYLGGLTCYRRELAVAVGGFRDVPDPRHDLTLRTTAAAPALHVPHVLCQRPARPNTQAVRRRVGTAPESLPTVTVVVPTKDQGALLGRCVDSVLARTDYPDLKLVLVDNGSREPDALGVLESAGTDPRVTVLSHPGAFNFARLCNAGAALAGDGVVVLLNNDTEVITPGWLRALVVTALEPGVGAVGAQLRYPDGRIQHAGIAGMGDAGTGHVFLARDPSRESPLGLVQSRREVLAVTGACLAIRADVFRNHDGLDEEVVPTDSGDIDLCLRLRESGLTSVYVPEAVLLHHESPSRQPAFHDFERFYLRRRWPGLLLNDPYLNPHLARSTKYVTDTRFGFPDVPPELLDRWGRQGSLPLHR